MFVFMEGSKQIVGCGEKKHVFKLQEDGFQLNARQNSLLVRELLTLKPITQPNGGGPFFIDLSPSGS